MMLHHLEIQHLPAPPCRFLPAEIDRNQGLPVEYTIPAHPPPAEIALPHWLTVVLFVIVLFGAFGRGRGGFLHLVDADVDYFFVIIVFVD